MSTLSVAHADPQFSAGSWGSLVILVWREAIAAHHLHIAHETQRNVVAATGGPISVLHLYGSARLARMDEQTRLVSAGLLQDIAPHVVAHAHVVEDAGFVASAVKSLLGSLSQLSRTVVPYEVFDDIDDALRWLDSQPDADPMLGIYADQVQRAVRELVDDIPAPPPAAANDRPLATDTECPNLRRCPMYPELKQRRTLQVLQHLYCRHDFERCARYRVMRQGVVPDVHLLPNGDLLGASPPGS